MRTPTRCGFLQLIALGVGLSVLPAALAQVGPAGPTRKPEFEIRAVRQQIRKAPDYSGSGESLGAKSSWANKPWLHIEVEFDSEPEWADDVQIKYYVLMGQGRDQRMLTGQMTHINVARGNRHYSAMFVHPSTLARYGQGKVEGVAVQIFYKGKLVAMGGDPPPRSRWWEQVEPWEGYLLPPEATPWSVVAFQRYEAAKGGLSGGR